MIVKIIVSISMKIPVNTCRLLCQKPVVFPLVDSKLWCHGNTVTSCSTMVCAVLLIAGFHLPLHANHPVWHLTANISCADWKLQPQSPPIICKAPTANRQRRWEVIRHADRQPPWTASIPVAKKRIIFNQLHIVNHSWSGASQEKYTLNHSH